MPEHPSIEEELKQERALLEAVLETAVNGIITIDESGTIRSANSSVSRIFGYTRDELIGRNVSMLMPEPDHSNHDQYLKNYLESKVPKIIGIGREVLGRRKDGTLFEVDLGVSETYSEGGRIFTGFVRDISSRKRLEQEVREGEERYRLLANSVPVMVWTTAPDGRITFVNERWYEYTGRDLSRATEQDWSEVVHKDDFAAINEHFRRAMERGERARSTYRLRRKDGAYRWHSGILVPSFVNGVFQGWVGSAVDTHDQTVREQNQRVLLAIGENARALADPKMFLASALETVGLQLGTNRVMYAEVSDNQNDLDIIDCWADKLEPIAGRFRIIDFGNKLSAELRGGVPSTCSNAIQDLPPKLHGAYQALDIAAYAAVPLIRNSKLVRLISVHSAEPREWAAEELELLAAVADRLWTQLERTKAEQSLQEAALILQRTNEELERKVHERTQELERALADAVAFSYSVSHDIRAPLRAMIATSRILIQDHGSEISQDARSLLERQVNAGRRLGTLVDGLLAFSRLGYQELRKQSVDMSAIANDVATELAPRKPEIKIEVQPGMEAVGDPALLRLVWQNYLENALKFSAEGKIKLGQNAKGAFFCHDEGVGFDMAYYDKLFQPFQRLVRDEDIPGTGIGLANVRTIVERHGGKAWAESKVGGGSTFYFTLA